MFEFIAKLVKGAIRYFVNRTVYGAARQISRAVQKELGL